MPGKSTYLNATYFNKEGVFDSSGFECTINNSYFRKGNSLSNQDIKEVLNICKKYHNCDLSTLIVKDQETLTIWIEEKSSKNEAEPAKNSSMPTKTVTRRYRGQVYEETVVDWSAVQQSNLPDNKPRRKYRGQYID